MKYAHILSAFMSEPWALEKGKLRVLADFLAFQATGGKYDDQEIEARISGRRAQDVVRAQGSVAVLPIFGVISQRQNMLEATSGGTSIERAQAGFRQLMAADQVKAIVMHYDTPGGQTYGVDEFAQEIFNARGGKPIIAQIDSCAASAGYWLAAAADEVVITPGGMVGSKGVFAVHEEISRALETLGVKRTLISSGGLKGAINDFTPLSDEALAEIQQRVDYVAGMFDRSLAQSRGLSLSAVRDQFGSGEMFTPPEALKRGMVDAIAPLSETLARFGVNLVPPARSAIAALRAAVDHADFSDISPSILEAGMREAFGFSKSQATAIASHGLKILRRGEPGEDRGEPEPQASKPAANSLVDAILASTGGYNRG